MAPGAMTRPGFTQAAGKQGNSCDPSLREPKAKGSRGDRKWMRPDPK